MLNVKKNLRGLMGKNMSKETKKEEKKTSAPQEIKPITVIGYSKIDDNITDAKIVDYSDGSSEIKPIDNLPAIGSEKV